MRRLPPGVDTALHYRRAWLLPDLRAGLVVTALLIPAGMGYAQVAGLPPETGLYATIVPLLAYALVGPSRILVLGPDSALAPIIAAAILPLAVGDDERAVALAGLLAIMVGAILLLGGILRLGLRHRPAVEADPRRLPQRRRLLVIISQVPKLLGFSIERTSPFTEVVAIVGGIAGGEVQPLAVAFGVGSLAVIIVLTLAAVAGAGRARRVVVAMVLPRCSALATTARGRRAAAGPPGAGARRPASGRMSRRSRCPRPASRSSRSPTPRCSRARSPPARRDRERQPGDGGDRRRERRGGLLGGFPISASSSRTPVAEQAGLADAAHGRVGAVRSSCSCCSPPGSPTSCPSATLAAVVITAARGSSTCGGSSASCG